MNPTLRIERALMSVLGAGGLTGARATGTATVRAIGASATVPVPSYAVPVLTSSAGNAQRMPQRLVKVAGTTTVTLAGTDVPIVAMLGGPGWNLPAGTRLRWDTPIAGVELESVVKAPGLTGGAYGTGYPLVRRVASLEAVAGPDAVALAAAEVGEFPAVVVSWRGGSPTGRKGVGKQGRQDRYRLYVVVSRLDGDAERCHEGTAILDELVALRCDRAAADGEVFSRPPIFIEETGRVPSLPTSYIYWLDVSVSWTASERELRTFADWTSTRERLQVPDVDGVTVVDQSHDMDPESP